MPRIANVSTPKAPRPSLLRVLVKAALLKSNLCIYQNCPTIHRLYISWLSSLAYAPIMVCASSTEHYHIPSLHSTVHRIPSYSIASKVWSSHQPGGLSQCHHEVRPHPPTSQTRFLLATPGFIHPPAHAQPPSTNDFNAVLEATQS